MEITEEQMEVIQDIIEFGFEQFGALQVIVQEVRKKEEIRKKEAENDVQ